MPKKLTETQRRNREIARLYRTGEWTRAELAEEFGLAVQTINGILYEMRVTLPKGKRAGRRVA